RQPLDRAGTPTGQHRLQITSPRLHGHKTPRIAVCAVNHPLRAAGHTRFTVFALTGIRLSKTRDHQEASLSNCAAEAAAISAIPSGPVVGRGAKSSSRICSERCRRALQWEQWAAVRLMWKELRATRCLRAKLERAIDCMRLIASRTK